MGKGFSVPRSFRGSGDLRVILDKNWRTLVTYLNTYLPQLDEDAETLGLAGDLSVLGNLSVGGLPLEGPHLTRCYKSTATVISSGTSWTTIAFDTAETDDEEWFSTGKITVDRTGRYSCQAQVNFDLATNVGYRQIYLRKNGVTGLAHHYTGAGSSAVPEVCSVSTIVPLIADDYVELLVRHTSGTTLTIPAGTPSTSLMWMSVCSL